MARNRMAPWGATDPLLYDLIVDGAMTHRQLWRRHGLRVGELHRSFPWVERTVSLSKHSRNSERIKFVVFGDEVAAMDGSDLRHLVIAAEARHQLKVPGDKWETPMTDDFGTWFGRGGNEPDALRKTEQGIWAVEVSVGSYSNERVLEKAETFGERYDGQLWVCPTEQQAQKIERLLEGRENVTTIAANPFVSGEPPPGSGWWRKRGPLDGTE